MGERADGQWAAPRVGVSVPRQNGKGALIEARELAGLLVFGEKSIVHSAHEQKTARVGFDRIRAYFDNYDDLRRKVKSIGTAVAREYIELKSGQFLRFPARSKGAIRGFSIDCLLLDEAQEFSDLALQAVMPTMAARPNPQMWLLGTPPTPANDGEVFARWREAGLKRTDRRLAWCEWAAEPGSDFDDVATWESANPALGVRISYEAVADERAALSDEGFARERLGMWEEASTTQVIDERSWSACADEHSLATERLVLGIDVNPERSTASIGLAGLRSDGRTHVELIETRSGTAWIVGYIANLAEKNKISTVVVDGMSPAASLVDDLRRRRIRTTVTNASQMGQACGRLFDGVMDMQLVHTGQPQLSTTFTGARKRAIGTEGAWGWNRKNTAADITPLVAVTLAAWGVGAVKVRTNKGRSRKVVVMS